MNTAGTQGGFVTANYVPGMGVVDPFGPPMTPARALLHAFASTTIMRCWHLLLFFSAWATTIGLINHYVTRLTIEPTLLTVIGTVLGFVVSYRTTSSFERYNEGRRLWAQIILGSRTFARVVWFHVPDNAPDPSWPAEEGKARTMVEKLTAINLLLAFSVGVKHYLRGEESIFYEDLYHLVKFLPAYALPTSVPSQAVLAGTDDADIEVKTPTSPTFPMTPTNIRHRPADLLSVASSTGGHSTHSQQNLPSTLFSPDTHPDGSRQTSSTSSAVPKTLAPIMTKETSSGSFAPHITLPPATTTANANVKITATPRKNRTRRPPPLSPMSPRSSRSARDAATAPAPLSPHGTFYDVESGLLPALNPPEWGMFDIFPFSLLVKYRTRKGIEMKGKKAARMRAKLRSETVSHNIPLEISLYLSSYVAALQQRKALDPATATALMNAMVQLVDALTGLERILTTPIPFSYSVHLWVVVNIYCLLLPFQIWKPLGWLTIPATAIISFIFFGFLVAGEEIENPFGYDKNDLNLDHFTSNIIRSELAAITSTPAPSVTTWAFSPANDRVFSACGVRGERDDEHDAPAAPEEWVRRGEAKMKEALTMW